MGSTGAIKQHAVCVPYPSQGHINPLMHVAKVLHSKGFHITFVNSEFNHKRYLRNQGPDFLKGLPDDFRFETIPDGLPPTDRDATQDIPELSYSLQKTCLKPFLKLLEKLNSSDDVPPVTSVVADAIMAFAIQAAKMIGAKDVGVWTASAAGMGCYIQFDTLVEKGYLPFKDENFRTNGTLYQPLDWMPGQPNMRLMDFPSFIRITDLKDKMFNFIKDDTVYTLSNASAILINTYDEFEHQVLEVLKAKNPNIYTVGPLPLLIEKISLHDYFKTATPSLWKEDSACLDWLDKREPDSVVYVNYGSIATMTDETLVEFAWGLANCGYPFLWIVRPDVMASGSTILPKEYFEEIKDRGLLASWCPQEKVLSHPSVGVFLSHCGWNSTLENIAKVGKPFLCWAYFGEQHTNTRYLCTTWEIGLEVTRDVKREEIVALVKEVMEGEKGKKMKAKALDWKKKATEATNVGGTSYNNLNRFFKEVFNYDD